MIQACMPSAKMLTNAINSGEPLISVDPQLSIIKISQLERVKILDDSSASSSLAGEPHFIKHANARYYFVGSRSSQRTSPFPLTAVFVIISMAIIIV